jgi:hypothetical protein
MKVSHELGTAALGALTGVGVALLTGELENWNPTATAGLALIAAPVLAGTGYLLAHELDSFEPAQRERARPASTD